MMALPDPRRLDLIRERTIPVTVLTGFLGSGKTTLIRRLLALPQAADTAVVVNEFSEAGLDHLLLERVDENIVVLPGGCLCCRAQGDIARALRSLQDKCATGRVPSFARVVIETSGLAHPAPILAAFASDPLRLSKYRLIGLVTLVDAVLGPSQLRRHETAQAQLALADRLLVTKLDLVAAPGRTRFLNALRRASRVAAEPAAPDARLLPQLFDIDPAVRPRPAGSGARHATAFDSAAVHLAAPLDLPVLQAGIETLARRHGDSLLRLKGIADVTGDERPVSVHAVQHLVAPPRFLETVPKQAPRVLVAIFPTVAGAEIRDHLREVMEHATPALAVHEGVR